MVTEMPKKLRVRTLRRLKILKGAKHWWNLYGSNFVIFLDHSERTSDRKKSVWGLSDILRLFVNILTANDKYCLSVKVSV